MRIGWLMALLGLGLVLGCSSEDEPRATRDTLLPPLAPFELSDATLLVPRRPVLTTPDARNPGVPADRDTLLAEGFGETEWVTPGESRTQRVAGGGTVPAAGPNRKRLVRFVHMPDLQLADDESPTRLSAFDAPGALSPALRPQDVDLCRLVNAAARSANALHAADPLDFLLLGGDNADSAQSNEVSWVMSLLNGADSLHCDSGKDDDPVPGPNNDGKDPFVPVGLDMPWYWVTGNHDILVQGNLPVEGKRAAAIGDRAVGGTRDWSQPGGPVVTGEVIADERRALLDRRALMQAISDAGGHGVGAAQVESGKATYTFDVEGTPLRFLVLDLAAETGAEKAVVRESDVTTTIRPLLDAAKAENKLVVLASHYAITSIGDGSGLGGSVQPDAWTPEQWRTLLDGYPNVVFSIVGHTHENRVRLEGTTGARGHWEVMTSSLADYPHQQRVIEIWDEDNGFLRLDSVVYDLRTDGDAVGEQARRLGVLDYTSGWNTSGAGLAEDRNVELFIAKP